MQNTLTATLSWTIALLVLIIYFLPGTFISFYITPDLTTFQRHGQPSGVSCLVIVGLVIIVWYSYWRRAAPQRVTRLAWFVLGLYLGVYTINISDRSTNQASVANCSLILFSLGAGLLAARLCHSPYRCTMLISLLAVCQSIFSLYNYYAGINISRVGFLHRTNGTFDEAACLPIILALT